MDQKNSAKPETIIVAYVPVLHEGYRRFFERHIESSRPNNIKLFLLGNDINHTYRQLVKDVRSLDPLLMKKAISALGLFSTVQVVGFKDLEKVSAENVTASIIMPDEDIMHELREKYLPKANVIFDTVFLRWDKHKSFEQQPVKADQTISTSDADNKIVALLRAEAEKASDWYRQIGAAVIKKGQVILKTHNKHLPSPQTPYIDGDPRSDYKQGLNLELSTSIHSEAALVTEAAKKGISLEGAEMYVTTFPCPPCAKMIAYSGIKKLYYADGYGVLDGESVLKSQGVEIIFVKKDK